MHKFNRSRWRRFGVVLAGVCASLGLASIAVANSNDAGSAGPVASSAAVSAKAKQWVKQFSAPVKWPGPNTKVKAPRGKKLTVITCGSQGITCVRVANGVKAAGRALGYSVKVVDGRSDPSVWNSAIRSAVASKQDGIALAAIPPVVVQGAIAQAKAAKIPIAAGLSTTGPADVKANPNRTDSARAQTAYVATHSKGNAKVLLIRDDEFPETKSAADQSAKLLPGLCGGNCKVTDEVKFTLALASQRLASGVTQALRSHPDINYIMTPFDTVNVFVQQGIRAAGKKGKVKIVGVGGDPPSVDAIKAGDEVASVGEPGEWVGWSLVDGLVRKFAGKKVPKLSKTTDSNYFVPQRYITSKTKLDPHGWQGGFNYQKKYKTLWGK